MKKQLLTVMAAVMFLANNCTATKNGNKVEVNNKTVELDEGVYALMQTTHGDILIKLHHEATPMTAGNFVALAEGTHPKTKEKKGEPFFDGLKFHRVIPDFMIQGGDPKGNGSGGPGYSFPDEIVDTLKHSSKGMLSMANSGPNTNGSQFFITVKETPWLDGRHTVFGKVVEGQNIADSISKLERGQQDKPKQDVIINKVKIVRVGKSAENFDGKAAFENGMKEIDRQKEEQTKKMEETLDKYRKEAKKTDSGLMYIITEEGSGPKPNVGDQVRVHYAGYLLDGQLFDTSIKSVAEKEGKYMPQREPYEPIQFEYGPGAQLIPGWVEGIQLLKVGDKARFIIPPDLGYGERGAGGVIPPNAYLIFDLELVEIVK